MHERRVQVARETGRRRRRWVVVALVLVLSGAGAFALVHSSVLGARHIEISGPAHAPYSTVVRVAGLEGAPPLVDLSSALIARRVESLPWVRTATVSLAWPTTVHIRVTDRVPVAAVGLAAGTWAVLDPTGRVLEDVSGRPAGLPVAELTSPVPGPGGRVGRAGASLARVAAATPEAMVARIGAIRWGSGGIEVDFTNKLVAVLGDASLLAGKFVSLNTVLARADLAGITRVNLQVPSSPVLVR
jgi:cell division septal protein FtsQ